jgi:hypothetical protein
MEAFEASVEASNERSGVDKQKIRNFAEFLGEEADRSVEDDQINDIVDLAADEFSSEATVAFEQEVELLKQTYDSFTETVSEAAFSEDASSLRSEYRQEQTSKSQSDSSERDFTAHLEANVIGIYW